MAILYWQKKYDNKPVQLAQSKCQSLEPETKFNRPISILNESSDHINQALYQIIKQAPGDSNNIRVSKPALPVSKPLENRQSFTGKTQKTEQKQCSSLQDLQTLPEDRYATIVKV